MEETLENRSSLAAPVIFLLAVILQLMSSFIGNLKKRGSVNAEEIQLRQEIKGLLKEASSLSNPSTFAQAAKLRRKAAAKEKELRKSQELHNKENKLPYATCVKALMVLKVVSYLLLVVWFWGKPVAVVSQQLLHPFGSLLGASKGQLWVNILESEVVYLMKLVGLTRDKLESDQVHVITPAYFDALDDKSLSGKVFSWRAGDTTNRHIMVGIIPWLIISNRVSGYICQKLTK